MTLNPINFAPPVGGAAPEAAPSSQLGEEEFLSLLMTQIQHQDPTNPMDSSQFMDQVTAMNTVKQLMSANDRLAQLNVGMASLNNESAVNLVGKEVVAQGNTFQHVEGQPDELVFNLEDSAAQVTVNVSDENGRIVDSFELNDLAAGTQSASWTGRSLDGGRAASGSYSYSLVATDADGEPVATTTFVSGTVDELRFSNGIPVLLVGGQEVSLDAVLRVLASSGDAAEDGAEASSSESGEVGSTDDSSTTDSATETLTEGASVQPIGVNS